jgi:hypothetical protein
VAGLIALLAERLEFALRSPATMMDRISDLIVERGAREHKTRSFRSFRRRAGWAVLFLVAGLALLLPAGMAVAESAEQAVKRVLQDKSIQSALPGKGQARAPLFGNRPPRPRSPPWSGFGTIGQIILWGLVIGAAGMLIFFILREYMSWRRRPRRGKPDEATEEAPSRGPAEPVPPGDLLAEADRLAARGAFAEAVHLILIHSLRRLEAGSNRVLGASLTAREIISRAGLQEQARTWFSYIVGASELVHFGGRSADAPAYAKCRDAFEKLAAETAGAVQTPVADGKAGA